MNILAIDPGTKTLGIATGNTLTNVATPLKTIKRTKFTADAGKILTLVEEYSATAIVIGLPLNMDGSAGCRVQSTKTFASNLQKFLAQNSKDIPIHFQDERLSTQAVERAMIEDGDLSRAKRAKRVDALAAGWILQGWLDSQQAPINAQSSA